MFMNKSTNSKYKEIKGFPVVKSYKFLGVTFSNNFKITPHTK